MTEQDFRAQARRHLRQVVAWFIVSLALAYGLGWIALWAEDQRGWESAIVYYVFLAAAALPAFGAFYFGVSIWAWFKGYRSALRDLSSLADRPDKFLSVHREVIGPIAWK